MQIWRSESFLAAQRINAMALSFDHQKIFAVTAEALYSFDPKTGKALAVKPIKTKLTPHKLVAGDGWVAVSLNAGEISLFTEALQESPALKLKDSTWGDLYRASPDGSSLYCNPGHPNYAIKRFRVKTLQEEWSRPGYCNHLVAAKDKLLHDQDEKLHLFVSGEPTPLKELTREKVTELALSADGTLLGYIGAYNIAHIKNLESEELLRLQMFWSGVRNVVFSPDQSRLLVSSNEGDYGCFDAKTGRTLYRRRLRAQGKPPLLFTDDVLYIAFSRRIERYDSRTGAPLDSPAVCSPIRQLCYSRGALFASSEDNTFDQQVLRIDASSGEPTASYLATKVASQHGQVLVAGTPSWLLSGGAPALVREEILGRDGCLFAALSPSATQFVLRDSHWPSQIVAYATDGTSTVLEKDSYPQPCNGAFSSDGSIFALISKKPGVLLYDTNTWEVKDAITADKLRYSSLAFHPEKPLVALIAVTGALSLVDYETKKERWSAPLSKKKLKKDQTLPLAFSPDGSLLFVALEETLQIFSTKDGKAKATQTLPEAVTALTLGDDGLVYLGLADCSLVTLPKLFTAKPADVAKAPGVFVNFAALKPSTREAALKKADWSNFVVSRDLVPLRQLLLNLEAEEGVTALHKSCTTKLQSLGARLVHANAHHTGPIAYALSHDGRYLAAGSWCGDDYERGGTLSVWEVATGRCVNAVTISGGVGWPDHANLIKWSPDDSRVGLAFSTNAVGSLDPFDPSGAWRGYSYATNGWDRPPAWCWSPEGALAFIACWGESATTPGGIIPLDQGRVEERSVLWMSGPSAANTKDAQGLAPHAEVSWSGEGKILGHNVTSYSWSGQAFAIDASRRELLWKAEVGKPVAFSDEHFAHTQNGSLMIHSLEDGRLLQKINKVPGASGISFTKHNRMALWVEEGAEFTIALGEDESESIEGTPGVQIFQQDKLLCHIKTTPMKRPFNFIDASSWVWSPDGERGAVLLSDRTVEIYSLPLKAKAAKKLASFQVDQYVNGLLWGAEDTIVAVSSEVLQLWSAAGVLLAHHPFTAEADAPRPLLLKDKDLGARFAQNPSFPVLAQGKPEWAVAFDNGLVACPSDAQPLLDTLLCWSLKGTSWPYRWSSASPREEVAEILALPECPVPPKDREALLKILSKVVKKEVFPPKKRATLDDLVQLYRGSLKELSSGWDFHVSEQKMKLSRLLGVTGKVDEAKKLLAEIPAGNYRFMARVGAAELSMHFAREKKTLKLAKEFLGLAEKETGPIAKWNQTWVHGSLGGAKLMLGDKKAAEAHFLKAQQGLSEEVNPLELYAGLAAFFLSCGEVTRAFETIAKGPIGAQLSSFLTRFIRSALAAGHLKETEALLKKIKKKRGRLDDFDLMRAVEEAFYARGEPEVLFTWLPHFEGLYYHPNLSKALLAVSNKTTAFKLWRSKLEEEKQWPDSFAFWVELGTRIDSKASQPYLDELYRKREALYAKASNKVELLQNTAQALLQSQREKEANTLLELASKPPERFFLSVILSSTKENAAAMKVLAAPSKLASSEEGLLAQAKQASLNKDLARYQECIDKMHQAGTDWDRRRSAEEAVRLQISLGDWAGVYASLQKIPPARRNTPLKEAAKGAARAGLLAECAFFLLKLPSTDLNDRPNTAFDAIDFVARRELGISIAVR